MWKNLGVAFLAFFKKYTIISFILKGNTVKLGDKELFGHPKIVP